MAPSAGNSVLSGNAKKQKNVNYGTRADGQTSLAKRTLSTDIIMAVLLGAGSTAQ